MGNNNALSSATGVQFLTELTKGVAEESAAIVNFIHTWSKDGINKDNVVELLLELGAPIPEIVVGLMKYKDLWKELKDVNLKEMKVVKDAWVTGFQIDIPLAQEIVDAIFDWACRDYRIVEQTAEGEPKI